MVALVAALAGAASARAQSVGPTLSDAKACVVVLEEMGDVGFRISDAQVVAEAVAVAVRKRVGHDGFAYAGVAASARSMKRLLNTPEGAAPQDAQLAWFKGCEDAAPWRIKARFGIAKKQHWITVACRKKDAQPGDVVEEKRVEGKTFLEARDALVAALPAFCPALAPVGAPTGPAPVEATTPAKPKDPKPWTPPPRRD